MFEIRSDGAEIRLKIGKARQVVLGESIYCWVTFSYLFDYVKDVWFRST